MHFEDINEDINSCVYALIQFLQVNLSVFIHRTNLLFCSSDSLVYFFDTNVYNLCMHKGLA